MKTSRSLSFIPILLLVAAAFGGPRGASAADGLVVLQQGDGLYATPALGGATARRIGTLPSPFADSRWAVSPDGRRIAVLARTGVATAGGGLATRPAVVTVSELGGRHRKRLFSTDTLRDRQGRSVTQLGLGADAAGEFADWEPMGLSWSADSRTLYLSCRPLANGGSVAAATFAVDGASGLALIDAQGRWKSIAPLISLDARGGRLVGIVPSAAAPVLSQAPEPARSGAVTMIDLTDASRLTLTPTAGDTPADTTFNLDPALSPDERRVAFTDGDLFVLDRKSLFARRLVAGVGVRPRWTPDGKSLYFLLVRPGRAPANGDAATAPRTYDLYAVDAPTSLAAVAPPAPLRLVLQGIDWFDVVPD